MKVQRVINNIKSQNSINSLCPEISSAGFVRTNDGWNQIPLYSGFSRLYYVIDGEGMLTSDGQEMPLVPGYVYLAPCGIKCGFYSKVSVTKLFFHINLCVSSDGSDAFESFGSFARLPYAVRDTLRLRDCYLGDNKAEHLYVKSEIMRTVHDFLKLCGDFQAENTREKPVREAIRYIRTHLTATLTVSEVAEAALTSESTLSAMFRREVGYTVASYIEDLVMCEAQNMLLENGVSIGEISERLGFCDQFYFSRRFKRRFGISPREYRNMKI
ncbi:MAG: helix-turn-helix domain-containing protein [Clostridia bacterium]|nr:helix-turn-helix domain-containing protein [Clostridia bacterium]